MDLLGALSFHRFMKGSVACLRFPQTKKHRWIMSQRRSKMVDEQRYDQHCELTALWQTTLSDAVLALVTDRLFTYPLLKDTFWNQIWHLGFFMGNNLLLLQNWVWNDLPVTCTHSYTQAILHVTKCALKGSGGMLVKVPSVRLAFSLAGRAGERPDQVSPSCCLIIDPSGIVVSIVSIMMALVLLSTLASRHS